MVFRKGGSQMADIFEFWKNVSPTDDVHPADRDVLGRVKHHFKLKCFPGCFAGPLQTAPVVLLYLSGGFSKKDLSEFKSPEAQRHIMLSRAGMEPFRDKDASGLDWMKSRTKCLGDWGMLRSNVALLNIGAYHSKTFQDASLLAALPSSRNSISWAQDVLFPDAIAGKRIVICLRAAHFWGLERGKQYGRSLFAPYVTMGGHMKLTKMRERIISLVKAKLEDSVSP
jgi:hypothetical protein